MKLDSLEIRSTSGTPKKLFTGFGNITIVAVNPTQKEIAELYEVEVDKVKEPNYSHDNNVTRLDFFFKNHPTMNQEFTSKFSVFVSPEVRVSQSNKNQYIDSHAKTCWADSLGDLSERNAKLKDFSKLKLNKVRQAVRGEEDLYNVLRAYGNVDTSKEEFMLDDFGAILKGKVSELRDYFEHFNKLDGGLKVLFGIKEGQYQDIYTNIMLHPTNKISDYVKNKITDESYGYKHYYGNSFEFKEFIASSEPATIESGDDPFSDDPFSSSPSTTSTGSFGSGDSNSLKSTGSDFDVDDLFG
jgi:hypothetical protein